MPNGRRNLLLKFTIAAIFVSSLCLAQVECRNDKTKVVIAYNGLLFGDLLIYKVML